ncbi:MAG: A24 family peptidase [Paracoccaceae bacterium]|jgi:prepilin signal peptidase PulO-like enzyme (type II secretory pathway)|nr:A24 family peptidase [Paracoccaceae bacterium]
MIEVAALWSLSGGALGAAIGGAIAIYRRDLEVSPLRFALAAGLITAAASFFVGSVEHRCLLAALTVLAMTDLKHRILPDELTFGLIVAGLIFALIGLRDLALACIGGLIGGSVLWALRAIWLKMKGEEALGLGDVKLLAGIGTFMGPFALPEIVFWAATGGIGLALLMALRPNRDPEIPFGATLGAACWLYLAAGPLLFAV